MAEGGGAGADDTDGVDVDVGEDEEVLSCGCNIIMLVDHDVAHFTWAVFSLLELPEH